MLKIKNYSDESSFVIMCAISAIITSFLPSSFTPHKGDIFVAFITIGFVLGMLIGIFNLFLSFIPWKIKIPLKRKSPIYKISELEIGYYKFKKYELKYRSPRLIFSYLVVPFLALFEVEAYEEVYVFEAEIDVKNIYDLGEFIENYISKTQKEKTEKHLKNKVRLKPLELLNKEFNENYK